MKIPFFLILFLFLNCTFCFSQIKIFVTGGGNQSQIIHKNTLPDKSLISTNYDKPTFVHFGFLADIKIKSLPNFYLQPGILFRKYGEKSLKTYDTALSNIQSINKKSYLNYVDFHLQLLYKIPLGNSLKLIFGGGPGISFFNKGKITTEYLARDTANSSNQFIASTKKNSGLIVGNAPNTFKTFHWILEGIAGLEFKNFFIKGSYSTGLSNIYTSDNPEEIFKSQQIGITAGILISKNKAAKDEDDFPIRKSKTKSKDKNSDKDKDGIVDKLDNCPDVPGLSKYNGCPIPDSDGDGINDELDKCKNVAGVGRLNGCPIPDTDGDGINDEEDKCITVPGVGRFNGCPVPDTDGDGLNDDDDKCPDVFGKKEFNGCLFKGLENILPDKILKDTLLYILYFDYDRSLLSSDAFGKLPKIVDLIKSNPELRIMISGHADGVGTLYRNNVVAVERANVVRDYFISYKISNYITKVQGFGAKLPLYKNMQENEIWKNRRVEVKIYKP
jgi:outer membrane protein OmpA-like peptidoglycan-associated protein